MLTSKHHAQYYFLLFSSMGIVSPYIGWWLGKTLPPLTSTWVLACFYITMIITPSLWGHAAFSSSKPGKWLSLGTLISALFALGLSQMGQSSPLAACLLMFSFGLFYTPLVSLLDAISYAHLEDPHQYSRVRMYGSLGFLMFSSLVGGFVVLEYVWSFPYVVCLLLLAAWIASLPYKKTFIPSPSTDSVDKGWRGIFINLSPLMLVVVIGQICFVLYYVYFAQHLKVKGFSNFSIGFLIGFATLCEIAAFWKIKWFFQKAGPWTLLALVSLASALRWGIIAEINTPTLLSLVLIIMAQSLHATGFSVFHSSCLKIIHSKTAPHEMGLAQGLYNAVGYGLSGVLGVGVGALLWPKGGHLVFTVCFFLSLVVAGFAFWISKKSPVSKNA